VCALLDVESRVVFLLVSNLTGSLFDLALPRLLERASCSLGFAPAALGFALHLHPHATACHPLTPHVAAAYG
jgi:hypothetical protein